MPAQVQWHRRSGSQYSRNVFPLDNSVLQRIVTPRPSATAGRNTFTYSWRALPSQKQAGVRLQHARLEALSLGRPGSAFAGQAHDGPGFGKGATGVLRLDNNEVAKQTIPFIVTLEETFDIGLDTRTGVHDRDYKPPFRFNGKLDKVAFNLGPVVLSEPDRKAMRTKQTSA